MTPTSTRKAAPEGFLTLKEVAALAKCSEGTARHAVVYLGELPAVRDASQRILVRCEDANHWAAKRAALTPVTKKERET